MIQKPPRTRQIVAAVIGMYADRKGRKAALQLIIALMTLSMAMIAFAPPYAAIGIAAPLLILLARLLQGFATGGEFASATSFLVESAPANKRGFYGSLQMVGQSLAALSGAIAGTLITRGLAPEQIDSWGWRLPFLFGLVICGTISYYVVLVYMPTFAKTQLGMPLTDAFVAQVIGLVCLTITIPLFGALSDRIGRKPVLMAATIAYDAVRRLRPVHRHLADSGDGFAAGAGVLRHVRRGRGIHRFGVSGGAASRRASAADALTVWAPPFRRSFIFRGVPCIRQ